MSTPPAPLSRVVLGLRKVIAEEARSLRDKVPERVGHPGTKQYLPASGREITRTLEGRELAVAVEQYAKGLLESVSEFRDGLAELENAERPVPAVAGSGVMISPDYRIIQ